MNIKELKFMLQIVEKAREEISLANITVFEYLPQDRVLKAVFRYRNDIFMEHTEFVFAGETNLFYNSINLGNEFLSKKGKSVYLYIPFIYRTKFLGNDTRTFVFRVERFDGKRFPLRDIRRFKNIIYERMKEFDLIEFDIVREIYMKNINIAASLGNIFTRSLTQKDSFKYVIKGIENVFGFDRIRFYRVDETNNMVYGVFSIDRTGMINDLSCDRMILAKGSSSLVDILLSGEEIVIKDYIIYLPLRIDVKKVGMLVVDNFLSRNPIKKYYIDLLKSFSSILALAVENIILFEKIEEISLYDELTKLPLRRFFNQRISEEFYRAKRFNQPLSLIWIDIDYFKEINDTYGHQVGDAVLVEVASTIMRTIRKIDFPCRWGGDEILIILPQSTKEHAFGLSKRLVEEIRKIRIDLSSFGIHRVINLSISVGIASYPDDAKNIEELLNKADEALYWVKSHGKDSIGLYSEIPKENDAK
jgi:diguanylate cyclase (GGDEF)-like protein